MLRLLLTNGHNLFLAQVRATLWTAIGSKEGKHKERGMICLCLIGYYDSLFVQEQEEDVTTKKHSPHVTKTLAARKATSKVDPHLEEQFLTGRLYGKVHTFVSYEGYSLYLLYSLCVFPTGTKW